jgi:hypothetical protein
MISFFIFLFEEDETENYIRRGKETNLAYDHIIGCQMLHEGKML